jgi:hypothetical protein
MRSPTYPRLSKSLDAVYRALWLAGGATLTTDELHESLKPGVRFALKNQNVRTAICRLREHLAASGAPGCILLHKTMGYYLDMAKAPPYRDYMARAGDLSGATAVASISPPPDSAINLERPCWLSNRFLEVV